jgi:hypothetical protein
LKPKAVQARIQKKKNKKIKNKQKEKTPNVFHSNEITFKAREP